MLATLRRLLRRTPVPTAVVPEAAPPPILPPSRAMSAPGPPPLAPEPATALSAYRDFARHTAAPPSAFIAALTREVSALDAESAELAHMLDQLRKT